MQNTSTSIQGIKKLALFFMWIGLFGCASSNEHSQAMQADRVLKKKIVMTGFAIPFPAQVVDLQDISQGLPREILNRLEHSGKFLIRQSPHLLSYDLKQGTPSSQLVKQVAAEYDAQFVIAGEVTNAGMWTEKKWGGLWETKKRSIEIKLSIYDGMSGVFLIQHHVVRQIEDEIQIGKDKPFGSAAFYATSYGKAMGSVVEEAMTWIQRDLSYYPLMAKITAIADQQIVFNAGVTSNIMVGDEALVVSQYDQLPTNDVSTQSPYRNEGVLQASMGKAQVTQTQLVFSAATLPAQDKNSSVTIKVGDFLRFESQKYHHHEKNAE